MRKISIPKIFIGVLLTQAFNVSAAAALTWYANLSPEELVWLFVRLYAIFALCTVPMAMAWRWLYPLPPIRSDQITPSHGPVPAAEHPTIALRPSTPERLYTVGEIKEAIDTLGRVQRLIDGPSRAAYSDLSEITQRWEANLRQWGAEGLSAKLKPIRNKFRITEREMDALLGENSLLYEELRPVVYDTPNSPGYGVDSALSMLIDDLDELAGAQNVNVGKWTRPRFEESGKMAIAYWDWIRKATQRIGDKLQQVRERAR
jgi:hypothetical protein